MGSRYELLSIERDGALAHIVVNRPPVNAINSALLKELHRAAEEVNNDGTTKVALLYPAGKHFGAGADIKEIEALEPGEAVDEFATMGQDAFFQIERGTVPVIALVRGFCLGGGCELAMACHIRIADESAVFGQPEIKLGICPGFGATQRLPQLVGRNRAYFMLLTGEQISARQAYEFGLVTAMAPQEEELVAYGTRIGKMIAAYGQQALVGIRELVAYQYDLSIEQGTVREAEEFGRLSRTEDMREGFRAFIEKRTPVFKDR
ncbi:MAG: enoyl-CoA hydratase-related protein [Candidatus Sumerlaeia bacterium]|nr:enoyl-CoA hydratase-related protein [Candidatus Sumerlaeia bacterium]